ncbi:MAG: hypothetical protein HGB02_00055 [Chlorobiaceae bacterium]|nr:hypothetical protein [Chlorobiaceae bacterium]
MIDLNQQTSREHDFRNLLLSFWRGKFIIAAVMLLTVAGAFASYYFTAPIYNASAMIMVKSPDKDRLIRDGEGQSTEFELPTSVELLKSYPLAEATVQRLMDSPEHWQLRLFGRKLTKGMLSAAGRTNPDSMKTRHYAEALQGALKAERIRGTNLIEVSINNPNPSEAALIANTVCEVYRDKNAEWSATQDISVSRIIERQIIEQEEKMLRSENSLQAYMKNNAVYEPTGNVADLQRSFTKASEEYETNRVQHEILRKQLEFIEQSLSEEELTFSKDMQKDIGDQLRSMRNEIRDREKTYIELAMKKGEKTPEAETARAQLLRFKTQVDQINRKKIAGKIANSNNTQKYRFDLLASKMQVNVRLAELENSANEYLRLKQQYQEQLNSLPAKQINYAKLSLDNEIAKKTYAFLKEKLDESRIKAASNIGGVVIIKRAYKPWAPESPKLLNHLAIGIGGGLLLGMFVVVMKEKIA